MNNYGTIISSQDLCRIIKNLNFTFSISLERVVWYPYSSPLSRSLARWHLRSTKNKSRTWDPVPTLKMRTKTSDVSVEIYKLQIKFVF